MSALSKLLLILSLLATVLMVLPAEAGIMEVGATANYRRSVINEDNYQDVLSFTGSWSYYFWEMSALELSYTNGVNKISSQIQGEPKSTITTIFELYGLDLVLTMGGKESAFQPYIKIGGAFLHKEASQEIEGFGNAKIESKDGIVPSAGLGFKIKMTNQFSIKVGADAWSSPLDEKPVTWDYAGRAGVSWMF